MINSSLLRTLRIATQLALSNKEQNVSLYQKEISLTSLYWCSVSVLAHFTNDIARVLVWLSRSLSLFVDRENNGKEGKR